MLDDRRKRVEMLVMIVTGQHFLHAAETLQKKKPCKKNISLKYVNDSLYHNKINVLTVCCWKMQLFIISETKESPSRKSLCFMKAVFHFGAVRNVLY